MTRAKWASILAGAAAIAVATAIFCPVFSKADVLRSEAERLCQSLGGPHAVAIDDGSAFRCTDKRGRTIRRWTP